MFPWNYGFHWSAGTIIFLGAFYTVLVVVATTLLSARVALAARTGEAQGGGDPLALGLSRSDRGATAPAGTSSPANSRAANARNAFDCRECETHAKLGGAASGGARGRTRRRDFRHGVSARPLLSSRPHVGEDGDRRHRDGRAGRTRQAAAGHAGPRGTAASRERAVQANGTAFRVHKREADVRVLSPVDGEVVETGGPERGWYLRVAPKNLRLDRTCCAARK